MKQFKSAFSTLKPYKKQMFFALTAALASSLGVVLSTYFIGSAIDAMPAAQQVSFTTLFYLMILLLFLYLVSSAFQWVIARLANRISYGISCDLRKKAFSALNELPLSFYDTHPHGDLLSRFTNDLEAVSDAFSISILNVTTGIMTIVISLIVMLCLNVTLALTVLLVTPICILFAALITRRCQKSFRKQQQSVGNLSAFVSEYMGNQKLIQAFGQEEQVIKQCSARAQEVKQHATKAVFLSALVNPGTRFVNYICYITVGVVGSVLAIHGDISVGIIGSFLIYSNQFAKPFHEISGITAQIQTALAAIERIFEVIEETKEPPNQKVSLAMDNPEGDVKFSHVTFSYLVGQPVLKDISFHAKPGQMVAVVGPTGCGKTTLINLLMRFYEPDSGSILLDGTNVCNIPRDTLRSAFGMVLQDTWLFGGTIAENIAYGRPDATREEIINAAKEAYAHGFIKRLPQGYDTPMQEELLSLGERQLLTIARVMLAETDMLILDEATSSVDTLTEQRIQKAVARLTEDKTSFVIAHRLSTIQAADLILVMQDGKIVERGTHETLLKNSGLYAKLYSNAFS